MHILITSDSFKGSVSSQEAARCIQAGFARVFPSARFTALPVADGGEGTVAAVVAGTGGHLRTAAVTGPLGEPIEAVYGLLPDGSAVIEMAAASGLPLVPDGRRDPSVTTTYGTGQLIRDALDQGCRRILVGIGGSATNDGGAGMAAALGVRFLDRAGAPLPSGGGALAELETIDLSGLDARLAQTEVLVASDVTNPLCGPNGASAVYGPQKGADPAMAARLDRALAHYGKKLEETFGRDFAALPGAGAAGGLGAGLMAFCGGVLRPGVEIVLSLLRAEEEIQKADLVITGEGRVDATSASGKLIGGLAALAARHQKPVIVLTGGEGPGAQAVYDAGIQAVIPIPDGPLSLEEALARAPQLIEGAAERTARLLLLGSRL